MIRNAIVALVFLIVINMISAQDLLCQHDCFAVEAFSAANVHRIRSLGVGPPGVHDLAWQQAGPMLFTVTDVFKHCASPSGSELLVWKIVEDPTRGSGAGTGCSGLAAGAFTHLALTSDKLIAGTDAGSLSFWELKGIWDRLGEAFLYEIPVNDGVISALLPHPSQEWLLVVLDSSRLFRFDLESLRASEIDLGTGEKRAFQAWAFSDDGLLLAAAGSGSIQIWDTHAWEAWRPRPLSGESVAGLMFTDDDSQLIVLAETLIHRWSLTEKDLSFVRVLLPHPSKRPCLIKAGDISPDGSLLMTIGNCLQTRAWDLDADEELFLPQLHYSGHRVGQVAQFSPDGRYLAIGDRYFWGLFIVNEWYLGLRVSWRS
ncbi:MAG: WD40 repeat domain-containing protein [Chloroflexi bacterium]|nr:WD40 repeat domain-containing protein [Chloroflexota bacterium]